MNSANIDYILDIFKALTDELPEQMLYREDGDSIELRTLDDTGSFPADLLSTGWNLIGSQMAEVA